MCNDVLVCCVRTGCAKIQRFSLKTENSKQQKTDVKTIINVQHSYSPFISRIDKKPELPQFICRQKRYTSRPDRPSLSCAVALHCVRSRLKITLFSWGHMRITILSTKTGPGNNSKRVIGTQILSAK